MYVALPEEGRRNFRNDPYRKTREARALEDAWNNEGVWLNATRLSYVDSLLEAKPSDVLRATEELLV